MGRKPVRKNFYKSQADRVLAKFGGARRLAEILEEIDRPRNPATIYKWTYPRDQGGTGGLIPTAAWPDVVAAARYEGLFLTLEDMDPRPRVPSDAPVGKGYKAEDLETV